MKVLVQHLVNNGRALHGIENILKDDLFDFPSALNKHAEQWHSEHERESDQLDMARRKLVWIEEELWEILSLLNPNNLGDEK